tara:strand:+ start:267 stop:713 length:447 start_codon:yes stop_codon:yes gene_type:complete
MKVYAGYINLKPINGVIFPSYAQNQINRNYILTKLHGEFFLSTNENTYGKNNIILRSLLSEKKLKGVSILSVISLPDNFIDRKEIYKLAEKNKKELHFVFEEIVFRKKKDLELIEENLLFNSPFFTKKKTNLTSLEKRLFIDDKWSFV